MDAKIDAQVEKEMQKRAGLRYLISLLLMESKPGAFLMSRFLMILSSSLMLMNSS